MPARWLSVTLTGAIAIACNREIAAPAVGTTGAPQVAVAQPSERQRRRAEAREQAEQKAVAERERANLELDALAQLPARLPKSLAKACDAMVAAYDGYMRRVLTDDMLTKWVTGGNEMQLGVFRKECMGRSIPVAACQSNGLAQLTREQYPRLAALMVRCAERHGGAPAGGKPSP
jgi:hypothetical protein